ncbi:hypothetical protein KUCAC02_017019 [Chaenocephalus aceratus]|nr:hypothetical protein KUCAC02_017019 [Chaenocephalus aceratus]
MEKIKLWQSTCEQGDTSRFLQLDAYIATGECDRAPIVKIVHTHLSKLKNEFNSYFPDIDNKSSTLDWTKHRNRLNLQNNLVTAVATISPRLTKLMRDKQAHVSH